MEDSIGSTQKVRDFLQVNRKAYSESCQTYSMERFAKIVNGFYPLAIFAKFLILDVWQVFEYVSKIPVHSQQ